MINFTDDLEISSILDGNSRTAIAIISKLSDLNKLYKLLKIEETHLKRDKVLESIKARLTK